MINNLLEKIEEYGRLNFDAGMDGASWDAGRRRDGRRTEEEAAELLTEITAEISAFDPNWQPIETAPKDGSIIVLRQVTVDNRTGQLKESYVSAFWGFLPKFQEQGEHWMSAARDGSFYEDREFVHQETTGKDKVVYHLWRGAALTHWAKPWEVKVAFPPLPQIEFKSMNRNV